MSESYEDKQKRIYSMCNDGCMDAQTALRELSRYILGESWYVVDPISTMQINPIIVLDIENRLKENKFNLKIRNIEKKIEKLKRKL